MEDEIIEMVGFVWGIVIFWTIFLVITYFLIKLPINIAKKKNLSDSDVSVIKMVSWSTIFIGIGWIIALIMVYVKKPKTKDTINDNDKIDYNNNLDALEKLNMLKEKGIITEEEFKIKKEKIINRM